MFLVKNLPTILKDRNVTIGAEFEFFVPEITDKDKKRTKQWSTLEIANYEFHIYEMELEKYIDGIIRKPPKLPNYVDESEYKDGDIIPEPESVLPKYRDSFLKLVDKYLYLNNWPIQDYIITNDNTFKRKNKWIVKPDSSVTPAGFEIVTPAMSLDGFLETVPSVFSCIDKYCKTDKTCGFHISLSLNNKPDLLKNVDMVKLVSFINEEYIYKLFPKRRNNNWSYSMYEDVRENYKIHKKYSVSYGHYMAVNFEHLKKKNNQYIEFRYLGGTKYQQRWNDIKKILGMYIYALNISCSDKLKVEYKRRLEKIIGGN